MADRRKIAAYAWVTLASFLFAFMFALPKLASHDGVIVAAIQVAFIRYAAGFATIAPFYILAPGAAARVRLPLRRMDGLHVVRALLGAVSVATGAYAVLHIPLANAQAIGATSGVFGVALAVMFLGERIGWRGVAAVLVSLAGALIVAEPRFGPSGFWFSAGAVAAFISAFMWGVDSILLKFTSSRDDPVRILMVINAVAMLALAGPALLVWRDLAIVDLALLAAMGPVAIIGQYFNIRGFRLALSVDLVAVRYSGIVFAALLGVALFDEWPNAAMIIGSLLVCGGALAALGLRSKG
ncbi:MAG: DMT family transporter [Rhodospirillaceae bacterium]|nr:DMT family transporter [Rhodospirillaceae bacterium]